MIILQIVCRLYAKRKYGSEVWFKERSISECTSTKDALKFALTNPLETLLVINFLLMVHEAMSVVRNSSVF